MPTWMKCNKTGDVRTEVYVNLDLALTLSDCGSGTRIVFSGRSDSFHAYIDVVQTPYEIVTCREISDVKRHINGHIGQREANMKTPII